MSVGGGGSQANVEFFFRRLYDCMHGSCYGSLSGFSALLANIWLWIIFVGYAVAVVGLFIIVYTMMRLFELRTREHHFYNTLIATPDGDSAHHARWQHIQTLMESDRAGDWREAIIEADIMLDEILTSKGHGGEGVGDKLKSVELSKFGSINDAWEAHKVRNQIAHEGSAFNLSASLSQRTIARYEKVFREFKVI